MQKLQLSIPEPCHESWQQMTPTEQGRFCNACAKEVVDFSMMTDTEVLNYFTAITHDKVCGRALPSQLERTITKPKDPKKRLFWYWNYIVMFFMFFAKGNNATAQAGTKPSTELSPVKNLDVRGKMIKVGEVKQDNSEVVTGKVTDIDGNPVSYASIRVKGFPTGVSADADGVYSIKVNPDATLIISAAGFMETEIHAGRKQSVINSILEKGSTGGMEVVVTTVFGNMRPLKQNYSALFVVKDIETGLPINRAKLVIVKPDNISSDIAFTDNAGKYQAKGINARGSYNVKIIAEGYESNEFTIDAKDFKDRKKEWSVLLRKQKPEVVKLSAAKLGAEGIFVMRCENPFEVGKDTLYVVDGSIRSYKPEINPDDIEDYSVLPGPAATALFGPDGANGAIVITTRKAKEISMKEVYVTSGTMMGGIRNVITTETTIIEKCDTVINTIKDFFTNSSGTIKVYPNPAQRGNEINISLKLKQTGLHQIQITDAAGRIILQKQINATAKEITERIMSDVRWSGGLYYISITDAKNKLISKSSFIFQ